VRIAWCGMGRAGAASVQSAHAVSLVGGCRGEWLHAPALVPRQGAGGGARWSTWTRRCCPRSGAHLLLDVIRVRYDRRRAGALPPAAELPPAARAGPSRCRARQLLAAGEKCSSTRRCWTARLAGSLLTRSRRSRRSSRHQRRFRGPPTGCWRSSTTGKRRRCGEVESEQSNTSIIFGRPDDPEGVPEAGGGVNPDLEMTRFLTEHTDFSATAGLPGGSTTESGRGRARALVAGLFEFVPTGRRLELHAAGAGPLLRRGQRSAPTRPRSDVGREALRRMAGDFLAIARRSAP
jgi:hypothetical protein